MLPKQLGQIVEIPDASLNEKLVPTNDNHEPSALSRESFEAASILTAHDSIKPRKIPVLVIVVICFLVAAFISWGLELLSSAQ